MLGEIKAMNELFQCIEDMFEKDDIIKIVISKPAKKSNEYIKITIERKKDNYLISKYTKKQVFHENIDEKEIASKVNELSIPDFRQINAWSDSFEYIILISKNGKFTYKKKGIKQNVKLAVNNNHNREKNYLIKEGQNIEPLVDMGIFTKDGKVVKAMYDKYKQINRFLEIIDDEIDVQKINHLNVIDFGCGKSYLTFIVYYYLTEIKKVSVNMIGLDLKADVIKKCNEAADKYGYTNLKFEVGDINGFKAPFSVDMVITLHACDTATDFALYNAINWNAKMIFSVPCCQHELNKQIKANELSLMTRYGIIKERFSALVTDAIRGNILEYCGYKTQLLEFIDFAHTPKNILIRAVKRPTTPRTVKEKALNEIENVIKEFNFEPTLYNLVIKKNDSEKSFKPSCDCEDVD